MAQGRPPRHSKSKRDPVTIDLEAEKNADETKAQASEQTGELPTETAVATADASETARAEANPETVTRGETAGASTAEAEAAMSSDSYAEASERVEDDHSAGAGKAPDDVATRPITEEPSDGLRQEETAAPADSTVRREQPESRSGVGAGFVAGLLGGVAIAIVAYGLQTAGVLPVPGVADSSVPDNSEAVATLDQEVASLKESVARLSDSEPAGSDTALAELKAQVAKLSSAVEDVRAEAQQDKGSADLPDLRQSVASVQAASQQATSDIAALADRVEKIEAELAKPSDETRLARSIAAVGLRSAIDRGGPFDAELQAYLSVAPNDSAAGELSELAAQGVPSQRRLEAAFPETATAILDATRPQEGGDGVFGRLMDSARSLVTVRPTGNVEGNTPEAIVARMEAKLREGDLTGVVTEWKALPEAGRKASQAFIDDVNRRLEAEAAVEDILRQTNRSASNATEDGQAQ